MNADDDGLFDPFEGAEDFLAVLEGERTHVETRDVVGELDAEWFAQHPKHARRIRKYVPGEFDNDSGGVMYGDPCEGFVVLVPRHGIKVLFPVGSFDERGWKAGGL